MTIRLRKWYRIDKANGDIEFIGYAGSDKATRMLVSAVSNAREAGSILDIIDSGRFQTSFAIYTREDRLTERELSDLERGIRR